MHSETVWAEPVTLHWSREKIDGLLQRARELPRGAAHARLWRIQADAASGEVAAARHAIAAEMEQLRERPPGDQVFLAALLQTTLIAGQIDLANELTAMRFGPDLRVEFEIGDGTASQASVMRWRTESASRSLMVLNRLSYVSDQTDLWVSRLMATLALVEAFHRSPDFAIGETAISLDDHGVCEGLAYRGNTPDSFLIPDAHYLSTSGYAELREHCATHEVAWEDRLPVVFWRGPAIGPQGRNWRDMERVRLCEIANAADLQMFDVGLSSVAQVSDRRIVDAILSSGLMRDDIPETEFGRYRFHVDIDGDTCTCPGLLQKLLTGSPVLKVASPQGFAQWYYDDLKPWFNFVPVQADLSDLVENAVWLREHDEKAREIGERGRALALALDYRTELTRSAKMIAAAMRFAAGREPSRARPAHRSAAYAAYLFEASRRPRWPEFIDRALEEAREAVVIAPSEARFHRRAGEVLLRKGEIEAARRELLEACELDPEDAEAFHALSHLHGQQGAYDEAAIAARRASEIAPGVTHYQTHLANLLFHSGRYDEAECEARRAIEIDASHPHAHALLSQSLARQHRAPEAVAAARRTAELDPTNAHVLGQLGNLLLETQDFTGAEEAFRGAIKLDPSVGALHTALSQALTRLGRMEEAIAAARAAVERAPHSARARAHLGNLLDMAGDPADAAACYREVLARAPINAELQHRFGLTLARSGDLAQAVTAAREAIRLDPRNAPFQATLADLLIRTGNTQEAEMALRTAIELDPDQPEYQRRLLELAQSEPQPEVHDAAEPGPAGGPPELVLQAAVTAGAPEPVASSFTAEALAVASAPARPVMAEPWSLRPEPAASRSPTFGGRIRRLLRGK